MNNLTRLLLFFVLPVIAVLSYPPTIFTGGSSVIILIPVIAVFAILAFMLNRGSSRALTLSIFIQGMNVIIRIMMFFNQAVPSLGQINWTALIFSVLGLALSSYLMLRLDKPDIRARLIT